MFLARIVLEGEVVDSALAASFLDTRLLAMLAATLLPLLVNLLTKINASDGLKTVMNIALTALLTVLALWINPTDQPVTLWLAVNTFLSALITSFVAYKGVWKPTGISGSLAAATPNLGLGSPEFETDQKGAEE